MAQNVLTNQDGQTEMRWMLTATNFYLRDIKVCSSELVALLTECEEVT